MRKFRWKHSSWYNKPEISAWPNDRFKEDCDEAANPGNNQFRDQIKKNTYTKQDRVSLLVNRPFLSYNWQCCHYWHVDIIIDSCAPNWKVKLMVEKFKCWVPLETDAWLTILVQGPLQNLHCFIPQAHHGLLHPSLGGGWSLWLPPCRVHYCASCNLFLRHDDSCNEILHSILFSIMFCYTAYCCLQRIVIHHYSSNNTLLQIQMFLLHYIIPPLRTT